MTHRAARTRRLLSSHEPADATEAAHRDAVLRLLEAPGDPASRARFEPGHLTASAFVVDAGPGGSRVLMVHHERLGRWLQPGGHLEPEDPGPLEAAVREVGEETGLALEPAAGVLVDVDVHPIPAARGEPCHLHFDLRFRFTAGEDEVAGGSPPRVRPGEGVSEVAWWAVEALERSTEAGLRRVAAKLADPREP